MTRTQILGSAELRNLHDKLRDPIEYRKSGLSLNHVIGCPIDCAYCIRHIYDNYSMKRPHLIMSDEDAVETLIAHKYFVPGVTPVQLFNKATDAFVPSVRPHLHETLKILDGKGFANDVFPLKWKLFKHMLHQHPDPPILYLPKNQKQVLETIELLKEL